MQEEKQSPEKWCWLNSKTLLDNRTYGGFNMQNSNKLYLYEAILLLALKDKEGTFFPMSNYHFALGGALLAELLLRKKISLTEKWKAKYAEVINMALVGDPIIDECLEMMKKSKRKARIETWVNRFSNLKHLKHRVAEKLCQQGILHAEEDTVLLLFKRKIYPEINPEPERKIISQLKELVFTENENIDPETVILLSIAKSTNLLGTFLTKQELKEKKNRIKQIVNGEVTGKATQEAIEAMQAAVMVACIVPAIAASTTAATT